MRRKRPFGSCHQRSSPVNPIRFLAAYPGRARLLCHLSPPFPDAQQQKPPAGGLAATTAASARCSSPGFAPFFLLLNGLNRRLILRLSLFAHRLDRRRVAPAAGDSGDATPGLSSNARQEAVCAGDVILTTAIVASGISARQEGIRRQALPVQEACRMFVMR
ncbi:hypothetical protein DMH27_07890 [Raoultella planticola]|nr:hypothetical protein [Raoultella planticola]